jgi:transposase-like protein
MTYPKEIIVKVLHLFVEGLSLSKIRNFIYQHEGYYLYDGTILYWVKKYSKILERFERELKPTVKGKIHTDEVQVKVKGKKRYSVNSIDSKSKYNLAGSFMKRRTKTNCRNHFGKLYDKIGEQVKDRWKKERGKPKNKRNLVTFVSDKFENYKKGFNYYFYRFAKLIFGVPIACKKYGLEHNNNPSERHNEDIKQRYKVTRGFNSDEGAEAFLTLRRIIYNFVRPHQTLERTPAEEGDINLSLGRNKLLGLIKIFSSSSKGHFVGINLFIYEYEKAGKGHFKIISLFLPLRTEEVR